jgi:galactose mutarotase-like enzyme
MAFSIDRIHVEGFDGIQIQTGVIGLTLLPELGGKVSSLYDLRTGREWLWRHPRYLYKRLPHGSSYIAEADTGGWDECFPSVSACLYPSEPWQGVAIQDHGELWSQRPECEIEEHGESITVQTRWQGIALPYTFTRTITLTINSSVIRSNYEVLNNADQPMNFIWCIHPLLAIEPGMELHLPSSARFQLAGTMPADLLPSTQNLQYPFEAAGLNFPSLPEDTAACALKIWSNPLASGEGWATLRARDGNLQMRWDTTLLPQLAVWMNFGAWAADGGTAYYNLGLEPCIGAQDSLSDAVTQYHLYAVLLPNNRKAWWLEIELAS